MTLAALFLHGFGQRYDLPISLSLYLYAAAGVVVVSFVVVVVFASNSVGPAAVDYPLWRARALDPVFNSPVPRIVCGLIGVLTLLAIIVCGFFGGARPDLNPAEYLTWIYFWAGLVIVSGLIGNLWTLFNPFAALFDGLSRVLPAREPAQLPVRLGVWPAAFFYFAFACLELTTGVAGRPAIVAFLAFFYTLWNVAGMYTYGRDEWLQHFEAFTVLFGIVGRFAPVEVVNTARGREVWLRPWGLGLLRVDGGGWDMIVFVMLMLSTLAFDGVLSTRPWQDFTTNIEPLWLPFGAFAFFMIKTLGLIALTLIFIGAFTLFMQLVIRFSQTKVDPVATMTAFVFTLVPIALVYNAAHNYGYLFVQSQGLIPLLADPLQRGWHLLPTEGYQVSFALAGAATVWYAQVILIVLGHVIAVFLAHLRAGERFRSARRALMSQYPMLALMVLYTMTSLWILAQPVTKGG